MEKLKKLLRMEAKQEISDELLDRLLALGTEISLNTYEPLIESGKINPDVFIIKSGLVRGTYEKVNSEITGGFALPGSMLFSWHSFYAGKPSFYRMEACCPTQVLRVRKADFDNLIDESHEFCKWVMSANQNQCYYNEFKNRLFKGDAKSRLKQLYERWSDIEPTLPTGLIASNFIDDGPSSAEKREVSERWRYILPMVPSKIIASYLGITEQHLSKIKREVLIELAAQG